MSSGCHPQVRKSSCLNVLFDNDLQVRFPKSLQKKFGRSHIPAGCLVIWIPNVFINLIGPIR